MLASLRLFHFWCCRQEDKPPAKRSGSQQELPPLSRTGSPTAAEKDILRYYFYIHNGIDTEHVAPMEDSWLENVLKLISGSLKVGVLIGWSVREFQAGVCLGRSMFGQKYAG